MKKEYENVLVHNPEELPDGIIEAAIEMMQEEEHGRRVVEITVVRAEGEDENTYKITPIFRSIPFKRIRRITGYLTGSVDTWNSSKRAELEDRVSHGV